MSTITVPAANSVGTSAWADSVANQLNQRFDYLTFIPGTTFTTPASGSATWVTLGNLTVPTWATAALVHVSGHALTFSAAGAAALITAAIGSTVATYKPRWTAQANRFDGVTTWKLTGISTGTQSLTLQATFVSGTLSADTSAGFDATVTYLG